MRIDRLPINPIIRPEMLPPGDGANINGPSLIRVPDWVERPLGRYYLYFAHHGGRYIRLAYADDVAGPWTVYAPGTLSLEQTAAAGHIASPDLHVDHENKRLVMFFHGPYRSEKTGDEGQRTFVAASRDGVHFNASVVPLGLSYFRAFSVDDRWYAIAGGGFLHACGEQSPFSPQRPWQRGHVPFDFGESGLTLRHAAVAANSRGQIEIAYSCRFASPESIQLTMLETAGPWNAWRAGESHEILQPATAYEGADLPIERSSGGPANQRIRQLRDPCWFADEGRRYLLWSVAGEQGIAIGEVKAGD